jgi:hypothetical protein
LQPSLAEFCLFEDVLLTKVVDQKRFILFFSEFHDMFNEMTNKHTL